MKNLNKLVAVYTLTIIASATLLASCAATPGTQVAAAKSEDEVVTGSRLPRKGPGDRLVKGIEGKDFERDRNTAIIVPPVKPSNQ
jgi:hypothetical protein